MSDREVLTKTPTPDLVKELARRGWRNLRADIAIGDLVGVRHTNYNTGESCDCSLTLGCYVNPDDEPMFTGTDPANGTG